MNPAVELPPLGQSSLSAGPYPVMELLRTRRSVRRFKNWPVPETMLAQLLEAGRLAPSRANSQCWRFVVVRSHEMRRRLHEAAYHQQPVLSAPLVIVVLGVVDPRASVPARTRELVDAGAFGEDVKEFADHVLDEWSDAELQADAALNSSIAATQIMLAAHGLGLGCCWLKLLDDPAVLRTLEVPAGHYHAAMLAIGYADEAPRARPRLPLSQLVSFERFGQGAPAPAEAAPEARPAPRGPRPEPTAMELQEA